MENVLFKLFSPPKSEKVHQRRTVAACCSPQRITVPEHEISKNCSAISFIYFGVDGLRARGLCRLLWERVRDLTL